MRLLHDMIAIAIENAPLYKAREWNMTVHNC